MKNKFPDFLIIGAMKCGTTSLHDYLGKHPDIYSCNPKEIHFFTPDKFTSDGIEAYKNNFISEKKLACASPQNYTKRHLKEYEGVPKRIKDYMPNVKLIYVVRDPLKRIVSHYNESQEGGYAPKVELNEFLKDFENNHYVLTSMYYYQIKEYLKYFSMDQILIVQSEELQSNRLNTLNTIFKFLEVSELYDDTLFNYQTNTSTSKKRKNILGKLFFGKSASFIRKLISDGNKKKIRNSFLFKRVTEKPIIKAEIDHNLEVEIKNFLREDVEKLKKISGLEFKSWTI